jgi:pimeloyl-ACP methyl ester carboxylesterase
MLPVAGEAHVTAVFLHGLACGPVWPLGPSVAAGVRVAYLDLPGHRGVRAPLARTIPAIAAQVATAVKEIGGDRFILIGHSLGGLVALHLETRLCGRVLETMVFATGARFANVTTSLAIARSDSEHWARTLAGRIVSADATILRFATANMLRAGRDTIVAGLEALEAYDATTALVELATIPRTLVYGTRDAVVTTDEALRLAHHLGARAIEIPDAGHFVMTERPREFRALCEMAFTRHVDGRRRRRGAESGGYAR